MTWYILLSSCYCSLPRLVSWSCVTICVLRSNRMNVLYLIVGLIALALLGYLFIALLKPEWFG